MPHSRGAPAGVAANLPGTGHDMLAAITTSTSHKRKREDETPRPPPPPTVWSLRVLARRLRVVPYKRNFADLANYCSMPKHSLVAAVAAYRRAARVVVGAMRRWVCMQNAVRLLQRAWVAALHRGRARARRRPVNDTDVVTQEPLPERYPHVWKRRRPDGATMGYDLRALGQMLAATGRFSDPLEWRGRLFGRADVQRMQRQLRDLPGTPPAVLEAFEQFERQRHCSESSRRHERQGVLLGLTRQMETALATMLRVAEQDQPGLANPGRVAMVDLEQRGLPPGERNPYLTGFAQELGEGTLAWANPMEAQQAIEALKGPFISALRDAAALDAQHTSNFLTAQVALLEGLPLLGTCCFQESICRFVVLARSSLERRDPFGGHAHVMAMMLRQMQQGAW